MTHSSDRTLLDSHPAMMFVIDPTDGTIADVNAAAERFYGWPRAELRGKPIGFVNTSSRERIASAVRAAEDRSQASFHLEHRRSNGEHCFVEVHSGPVSFDGRELLLSIIIDETPRIVAERALERRDRLYEMLSATNQSVLRASDRDGLLAEVCRVAVERGGFRFAWVGSLQPDGSVRPEMRAGDDGGYVDAVRASVRPDDPHSTGPTAQAIRGGEPVIVNDFLTNPLVALWRDAAIAANVAASAVFPLREEGVVVATLNLYSAEPGFFAEAEVATLLEMASDVSFGLDKLTGDARRLAAEERAETWSVRLEHFLESSPTISYAIDVGADGWRPEWVSGNAERILGYTAEELLAPGWWIAHLHPDDRIEAQRQSGETLRTGTGRLEYRFLTKAGESIWILDSARFTPSPSGVGGRVSGTWTDVTARRLASEALLQSEERLRLALSAARQGLYDLDLATGDAIVSAEYATMLGFDPASFRETNAAWRARLHPDDAFDVFAAFEDYVAGRRAEYRVEFRTLTKDGRWIWVLSVGGIVERAQDGRPLRLVGTHTDISELKESQAQLALRARTSQAVLGLPEAATRLTEHDFLQHGLELIRELTESRWAFLHLVDEVERTITLVNESARAGGAEPSVDLGIPRPAESAGTWADAFRLRRPVVCDDFAAYPGSRTLPGGPSGLERFVSVPVIDAGKVRLLACVGNKATAYLEYEVEAIRLLSEELWRTAQRRRLDLAHLQGEQFRSLLLENLAEGVVAADAAGRLTLFNRKAREWHGIDADATLDVAEWPERYALFEADGRMPLAPERIPLVRAMRGETVRDATMSIVRPDLPRREVLVNGGPLRDEAGRQVGAIIVMHDLTEQRQAETALRLRSAALESAADAIVITDRDGVIEWANPAFTALTGYSVLDAVGRNPRALVKSGVQDRAFYESMWRTLLEGRVWRGELVNRRKDGTDYPELMTITPVRDETGAIRHFIAIKRDITEERALRANLLQAQKMESVGRLAGGVAHDFNNLLTVIGGSIEFALSHVQDVDPIHSDLLEIQRAGDRAAALTRQLLAFSRRQILRRSVVNLNELVGDLVKMLGRLIGKDVVLRTELATPLGVVLADPGQLEQVVMNLVVNARDAMPTGGTLTITTGNVELDAADAARDGDLAPGAYVRLSVGDTGVGMNAATRQRLFEPFFTTKEPGKGTGLGLSTVYGIVRQSGGAIHVVSEPGQGSTFVIDLPRVAANEVGAPAEIATSAASTHRGTILVVDDEEALRAISVRILARAGYTPIAAASAEEALRIVDGGAAIDLVLTDVVMPGMSGPELASNLLRRSPAIKVLFTSGFTDDMVLRHGVDESRMEFLPKPFKLDDLIRRVAKMIGS